MTMNSTLSALLEVKGEPAPAIYKSTVDRVIEHPEQISCLTESDVQEDVLIHLTMRSDRLVRFFYGIRPYLRANPKSWPTSHIAAGTANFLLQKLPALYQLISHEKVLHLLIPALQLCLAPPQPPPLRKLALVLADCGSLLEYLASDSYGGQVFRHWACTLGTSALEAPILEAWTERLSKMVGSCKASHDVSQTIQQCDTLKILKSQLRSLEAKHSAELSKTTPGHDHLPLSCMTQLSGEDKKTRVTGKKEPKDNAPTLDDNTKGYLKVLDLPEPTSWAALRNVIERLKGEETSKLLLSVATHFPCELCMQGSGSLPQTLNTKTPDESTRPVSSLQMEILGKALGVWQILLSVQALRSLQAMSSQGLVNPVGEKLQDLASGCWDISYAGTEAQRKRLKVPLFKTECARNKLILWQVDIGIAGDVQVPEQVIRVWQVGSPSEMDKVFDSVALLQRSYSPESVRRCRQRPSVQDKKFFPARFEDMNLPSSVASLPVASLDVGTVDQDTIDMANKFYALTEPTFRAILTNDLSAEFPFDLSREEARVISHFQTASLILGRSGTGKTTCLIFKMVAKYLTSKAVMGERPVRQVLLTRSSFLADKLRAYARGLIKTIESKSVDAQSLVNSGISALTKLQKDWGKESASTLDDHLFPLVLTFDDFLRILENTAEILDRNGSSNPRYHVPGESAKVGRWQQRQFVDFAAFKLDYWPRLPQHLTRKLSVNLVFSEIMGVIKGSASSGQSLAPLSRQQYLDQSCRLAPVFVLEDDRSLVYDIFEKYEGMKQEHQDTDNVDRVVRMMSAIRRNMSLKQLLESAFHEVYIDEVQDQRCVDVQLLLEFIRDSRGLHFAGDTAQAISQDSTFRFSDIKSIIHEHFAPVSAYTSQSQLARTTMFSLSKNYRSHKGIMALASLVMGMIWKGFPETVDKLEPEAGDLKGPKPVLFLGCDANILRTTNVGLVNLSDRVADFGAEQVILVRDESMKTKLQREIGDIALILTILDSKGMEFDDVILWDFFTSSADPSGVRSLSALTKDAQSVFDGQRHSGMCSELKHLYVAITRARIQLFLIESSEKATASIVGLLTSASLGSPVDVTRPHERGFPEKLRMLRPGTSVDPVRWSLRGDEFLQRENYEAAVMCYGKAKNYRGKTIASGKQCEAKGRSCGETDIRGFTENLEAAIELFLEVNLIGDAAINLERLTRFRDAAELWLQHNEFAKAAPLFAKADLYVQAADCYHAVGSHGEAAAILRQGGHYNQMVVYLCDNREDIPTGSFQRFSLLCKLLLKQNRISPECRKHAVEVLGSSVEQEACFVEYGMDEDLANLYSSQHRHMDLFYLCSRKAKLEQALSIAITKGLLESAPEFFESAVLSLLDYIWAGHVDKTHQQDVTAAFKMPSGSIAAKIILRSTQWEASHLVFNLKGSIARQHIATMERTVPKAVLCLRTILDVTAITQVINLDDLPFEMMQEAIGFAKDLVVHETSDALRILLLLAGLWRSDVTQGQYVLLPWSPLRRTLTDVSAVDAPKVAKKWFLDFLVSAVLAMDTTARELWKSKWPTRCVHFLTIGSCPRQRAREPCLWLHESVNVQDCSQIAEGLLQVNGIFCDLAVLYYHRAMNGTFQEKFLGIKRRWLERLLRELTYLSATEQHTSTITKTQAEVLHCKKYSAISSALEELLYFRLHKEWSERSDFTSLLEQVQLSQAFRASLQNRIFRALSSRLHSDGRGLLQGHLDLLISLKQGPGCQNASTFQSNLNIFLHNLDNIDVQAFSTLHALTAVFEYFAAYLVLKTCVVACVLPQAWIDLYAPQFTDAIHSPEPSESFEWNHMYQRCLMELTKAFCRILHRFNEIARPGVTLLCSGKTHHPLLLRQRNAELVAVVVANLITMRPTGFTELWTVAKEVFEYDFIRAYHLRCLTPRDIISKLELSFSKYNGKDALTLVIKNRNKAAPLLSLEKQLGVKTVSFDQICPRTPNPTATKASATMPPSTPTDSPQQEYTPAEMEAATKIQRLWRCWSRKTKNRRSYMQLPMARAMAHFVALGAECPAMLTFKYKVTLRHILISKGVAMSLKLAAARDTLSKLQKDAMTCVEKVEISTGLFESVDDVLHRNSQVEGLLRQADKKMSDERLAGLVKLGEISLLEKNMKDVEDIVMEVEQGMLETRTTVDAALRKCT